MFTNSDMIYQNLSYIKNEFYKISDIKKYSAVSFLRKQNLFNSSYKKLMEILESAHNLRGRFLPILFLNRESIRNGVKFSTLSFTQLIDFYSKAYEIFLSMYDIVFFANNLIHRRCYSTFKDETMTYSNKNIMIKNKVATKWDMLKLINDNDGDLLDKLFKDIFDNKIRNSINHNDYVFDPIKQIIYFKNNKNEYILTLYELAIKCLKIYEALLYFNEILWGFKNLEILTP